MPENEDSLITPLPHETNEDYLCCLCGEYVGADDPRYGDDDGDYCVDCGMEIQDRV